MSIKKRSIITGILYLSLAFIGPIGLMLFPQMITVDALASSTINPILIYLWFIVELSIIIIEVFLTIYLWKLLNIYNKQLSTLAFVLRMIMIVIMGINSILILMVAISEGSIAAAFLPLHQQIVFIWQIVFSIHVAIIGYLVLKYNKVYWRYLGFALILGSIGYLLDSLNHLVNDQVPILTQTASILLIFVMIGEIGMAIGLLLHKIVNHRNLTLLP